MGHESLLYSQMGSLNIISSFYVSVSITMQTSGWGTTITISAASELCWAVCPSVKCSQDYGFEVPVPAFLSCLVLATVNYTVSIFLNFLHITVILTEQLEFLQNRTNKLRFPLVFFLGFYQFIKRVHKGQFEDFLIIGLQIIFHMHSFPFITGPPFFTEKQLEPLPPPRINDVWPGDVINSSDPRKVQIKKMLFGESLHKR